MKALFTAERGVRGQSKQMLHVRGFRAGRSSRGGTWGGHSVELARLVCLPRLIFILSRVTGRGRCSVNLLLGWYTGGHEQPASVIQRPDEAGE